MCKANFYLCKRGIVWYVNRQSFYFYTISRSVKSNRRKRYPVQISILIGSNDSTLVIKGHSHPRTLVMFFRTIQMFCMEAGRQFQFCDPGILIFVGAVLIFVIRSLILTSNAQ